MRLGGDMGPNMGTTINKIACATNWRKLNSTSYILFNKRASGVQPLSFEPIVRTGDKRDNLGCQASLRGLPDEDQDEQPQSEKSSSNQHR
ncbi:hypothetical protein E2C01_073540 [Portunus trituberculatus]|uniref:Uncharacterized protein n=1 Tax=Portunus trituberculatus TaxID=210409 RepID=A0A5B7IAT9_PORTR|nr:hypothetical protein [Portunus trituberculatus]